MQLLRIFKEKSLGRSLGILVSGTVDIIANGRKASIGLEGGGSISQLESRPNTLD